MARGRVRIDIPPGNRACNSVGPHPWVLAVDEDGTKPFSADLVDLKRRFPSDEARVAYMEMVRERMELASSGSLSPEFVDQLQIAPDVLEIRLPDWTFSGGKMHVRLYYCEPFDLPGHLVALRLKTKRPGPIGLDDQNAIAVEASRLLFRFQDRGFA